MALTLNPGDDKYASVTFLHEATWTVVDVDQLDYDIHELERYP